MSYLAALENADDGTWDDDPVTGFSVTDVQQAALENWPVLKEGQITDRNS